MTDEVGPEVVVVDVYGPPPQRAPRPRPRRPRGEIPVGLATALVLAAGVVAAVRPPAPAHAPVPEAAPVPAPAVEQVVGPDELGVSTVETVGWAGGTQARSLSFDSGVVAWADRTLPVSAQVQANDTDADEVVLAHVGTGTPEVVATAAPGREVHRVVVAGDVLTWLDLPAHYQDSARAVTWVIRARSVTGGDTWTVATSPVGGTPYLPRTVGRDGLLAWLAVPRSDTNGNGGLFTDDPGEIRVADLRTRTVSGVAVLGATYLAVVDHGTLAVGTTRTGDEVRLVSTGDATTSKLASVLDGLGGVSAGARQVLVQDVLTATDYRRTSLLLYDLDDAAGPLLFDLGAADPTSLLLGSGWVAYADGHEPGSPVAFTPVGGGAEHVLETSRGQGLTLAGDGSTRVAYLLPSAGPGVSAVVLDVRPLGGPPAGRCATCGA